MADSKLCIIDFALFALNGHLFTVLTYIYTLFHCSFANKNRNSDTKELRFLFFYGIIELQKN